LLACTTALLSTGATNALAATVPAVPGTGIPLPTGRALAPAGTLLNGGDFPASAVYAGGGFYAADNGQSTGSVEATNPAGAFATTSVPLTTLTPPPTNGKATANSGRLAVSPDGTSLYLPGAALGLLHTFSVGVPGGAPRETATVQIAGAPQIWGAAGLADGTVVVTQTFRSGGLGPSTDQGSAVLKVNPTTGAVLGTVAVGREPFGIIAGMVPAGPAHDAPMVERAVALDRDSGQLSVIDPATMTVTATVAVGRSPADAVFLPGGHDLLVTCSLDDTLLDIDTTTWTVRNRLSLRPAAGPGAGPTSIAVDPQGVNAYVTLSADNAVAVLDHATDGSWTMQGQIPTAAYPTGVAYAPASTLSPAELMVTDGKGTGLPLGTPIGTPEPATTTGNPTQTGTGLSGSLEIIAMPTASQLAAYTQQVTQDNSGSLVTVNCQIPAGLTGITHVVYVIRENKTFDEEFGDTRYGQPGLAMYPQAITPNTHAIAARSVLLGNFYSDEEVSDTGHAAVMGGVANDFLQRTTQQSYGLGGTPRQGPELGQDDDSVWSPTNFLLDNALAGGLSFRDYGEFYRHSQSDDSRAISPALQAHIETGFPGFGFDPNTPDTKRIAYWNNDFQRDIANNTFPQLEVIYLPEDHTTNNTPTAAHPVPVTPQQQVADSDLATGQLVSALSHSPYWDSTAVFLTEDDPQSGQDHIDDHRTIGLVTGGRVSQLATTTHYDSGSMLRTIEESLRLPAMTEFDATATPMDGLFSTTPDPTNSQPYDPITPSILTTLGPSATTSTRSHPQAAPATTAATSAISGQLSTLPAATQFAIQWKATHGTAPVPAHLPRPAWASTAAQRRASAVSASVIGGCATPTGLAETAHPLLLPVFALILAGSITALRRRRRHTR